MRKLFMITGVFILFLFITGMKHQHAFQCTPCGNVCDKTSLDKPGECSRCHMKLVKKSTVTFKSIQPSEICDYIAKHPDIVLLDVRTKEEFEGKTDDYGTLKNAVNIPIQELESRLQELNNLKEKEIVVYCSHSRRSPRASYLLTQNGFKDVTNLEGGISTMKDNSCKQ